MPSSQMASLQMLLLEARGLLGRLEYQRGNVEGALRVFDVDNKLQETVSHAVELLLELWKRAGCDHEAMSAYRRALLSQWNLENDCCARIQKGFAVLLLYGGVEAGPPSLAVQIDGSYVPRNNLEEAILLLMILMRKSYLGKIEWDPSVVEHLTFALSLCSQTSVLAKQLQKAMPGVFHRVDRWKVMAFCYSGAGLNKVALNLLRKSLHNHEKPDDLTCLLLAAKIFNEDTLLAVQGMGYAQRAIVNAVGVNEHLKGVGLRMLGLCLGKQSKVSSSDFERSHLQFEALNPLDGAIDLECNNSDLIFELEVHYAEHRNLNAALHYSKQFIDATGGSILKAQRKSFGPLRYLPQIEDDKVNEFEVWHGLANLYSSLSHWKDAEICLEKARALFEYFAEMMHTEGIICEERGQIHEALAAYINALLLEPGYVPCKVLIGAVLSKMGSKVLLVARSILSDALRIQPTNHMSWYYLGLVHRDDGRIGDAIDCFQAASMLNESDPIESFSSMFN
ncbi:hypothetical protein ACSBR1_005922 [Camellia fascicularis]